MEPWNKTDLQPQQVSIDSQTYKQYKEIREKQFYTKSSSNVWWRTNRGNWSRSVWLVDSDDGFLYDSNALLRDSLDSLKTYTHVHTLTHNCKYSSHHTDTHTQTQTHIYRHSLGSLKTYTHVHTPTHNCTYSSHHTDTRSIHWRHTHTFIHRLTTVNTTQTHTDAGFIFPVNLY